MSIGRRKAPAVHRIAIPPVVEPIESKKLKLASEIIDLAVGADACYASRVRLARKHSTEQLHDILYLFKSFGAGN